MTLGELQNKYETSIGMFQPNPDCKHCHGDGERTIRSGANTGQSTMCVCLYVSHDQSDAVGDMLAGELMVFREVKPEIEIEGEGIDRPTEIMEGMSGYEADLEWAYQNLGKNLIPSHAPSPGAWFFHEMSKEDKKGFIASYKAIIEQRTKKAEGKTRMRDDHRTRLEVIGTLLKEFENDDITNLRVALVRNPDAAKPIVDHWLKDQKSFRDEFLRRAGKRQELLF